MPVVMITAHETRHQTSSYSSNKHTTHGTKYENGVEGTASGNTPQSQPLTKREEWEGTAVYSYIVFVLEEVCTAMTAHI